MGWVCTLGEGAWAALVTWASHPSVSSALRQREACRSTCEWQGPQKPCRLYLLAQAREVRSQGCWHFLSGQCDHPGVARASMLREGPPRTRSPPQVLPWGLVPRMHLERMSSGSTAGHEEAVWNVAVGPEGPGRIRGAWNLLDLFPGWGLLQQGGGGDSAALTGDWAGEAGSDHKWGAASPWVGWQLLLVPSNGGHGKDHLLRHARPQVVADVSSRGTQL